MSDQQLATLIRAVLLFLAPVAVWAYKELRDNWRTRLKADIEILKLCREAEANGADLSEMRLKIEHSVARRAALFNEQNKYDWTYALLAVLAIIGTIVGYTMDAPWLTRPLRATVITFMLFMLLGAVLNFFEGEPRWRGRPRRTPIDAARRTQTSGQ